MSIQSRTFNAVPGTTSVAHPVLGGATLLGVKREGVTHYPGIITPGNLEFVKSGIAIHFNPAVPFTGDTSPTGTSDIVEKVWVLFRT